MDAVVDDRQRAPVTVRVRCPICGHEGAGRLPRDGRYVGDTTVWCPRRHKPARPGGELLPDKSCVGRYEEGEIIGRCFAGEDDH